MKPADIYNQTPEELDAERNDTQANLVYEKPKPNRKQRRAAKARGDVNFENYTDERIE